MYISEQEMRAALTYEALIPAIRQALIDYSSGRVIQPARMIMRAAVPIDGPKTESAASVTVTSICASLLHSGMSGTLSSRSDSSD